MDDGQKQTINHVYYFLRDLLHKYEMGFFLCNGRKPSDIDLKSMIWYLETNFPEDMLEHEMGDMGFLIDEDEDSSTYSDHMQEDDEDA